jgi:hypothetical protein
VAKAATVFREKKVQVLRDNDIEPQILAGAMVVCRNSKIRERVRGRFRAFTEDYSLHHLTELAARRSDIREAEQIWHHKTPATVLQASSPGWMMLTIFAFGTPDRL